MVLFELSAGSERFRHQLLRKGLKASIIMPLENYPSKNPDLCDDNSERKTSSRI